MLEVFLIALVVMEFYCDVFRRSLHTTLLLRGACFFLCVKYLESAWLCVAVFSPGVWGLREFDLTAGDVIGVFVGVFPAMAPGVEFHTGSNGLHNGEVKAGKQTVVNGTWDQATEIFEYTHSANPEMIPIPIQKLDAKEHMTGPSRVTALDVSKAIGIEDYPATTPNLLASFVRVCVGESVTTNACATSQAFYVIHGQGKSQSGLGVVEWSTGDFFVFPSSTEEMPCTHLCLGDEGVESGGAGLYWVSDAPLLSYLGVAPKVQKFKPAYFRCVY